MILIFDEIEDVNVSDAIHFDGNMFLASTNYW